MSDDIYVADNPSAKNTAALEMRTIHKSYGGVAAVDGASVVMATGSIHALIGANGAGKSTLGKILAGAVQKDAGEISLDGKVIVYSSPRDALKVGIALIAQELALAPAMTVMQNVYLGVEPRRAGFVNYPQMRRDFAALVARSGLTVPRDAAVHDLCIADQQKVEILRAIGRGANVIIMDEPTSSLTRDEIDRLHALMRDLRADGKTVIYVSHFLQQVLDIADTITIMRNGQVVRTSPAEQESEQSLVTGMLGHEAAAEYPTRVEVGERSLVLDVQGVTRAGALSDVSFQLGSGEILGVAGLVGSGRSELMRAVFGSDQIDAGTVSVLGKKLRHLNPRAAMAAGMAMVPEDRKRQGLFQLQSAAANTTLPHLSRRSDISRFFWIRRRNENKAVRALLSQLMIKPDSPRAGVATMSGGNQQKVLLGRCLFGTPKVLLLDEPTRGVDIGARIAIHELIGNLARQGVSILLISSEIEEVIALSHRILVLRQGTVVAEFGEDPPLDAVMQAAFGLQEASPA